MPKPDPAIDLAFASMKETVRDSEHGLRAVAGLLSWMRMIDYVERNPAWGVDVGQQWARLARCVEPLTMGAPRKIGARRRALALARFGRWLSPQLGWNPATVLDEERVPAQVKTLSWKGRYGLVVPMMFEPWVTVDATELLLAVHHRATDRSLDLTRHYRACPVERIKRKQFALGSVVEEVAGNAMASEPPLSFPTWHMTPVYEWEMTLLEQVEWNVVTSIALHARTIPNVAQRLLAELGMSTVDDLGNIALIGDFPDDLRAIPLEYALSRVGSVIYGALAAIPPERADGLTCLTTVMGALRAELDVDITEGPDFKRVWSMAFDDNRGIFDI